MVKPPDHAEPAKRLFSSQILGEGVTLLCVGPDRDTPGSVRRERARGELWANSLCVSTVRAGSESRLRSYAILGIGVSLAVRYLASSRDGQGRGRMDEYDVSTQWSRCLASGLGLACLWKMRWSHAASLGIGCSGRWWVGSLQGQQSPTCQSIGLERGA